MQGPGYGTRNRREGRNDIYRTMCETVYEPLFLPVRVAGRQATDNACDHTHAHVVENVRGVAESTHCELTFVQ